MLDAAKSQSELRLLKAKVLTINGTIKEANQNFEKSIELNSNFINTWEYANFLQYQGKYDKSINYYNVSLTKTTDKTELGDIYNNLANSYSQQNDFFNSDKYFKKALEYRNTTIS